MSKEVWMELLFGLIGCFSIAGGVMNWNWYMQSSRAAWLVKLIGRNNARIFYIVLGLGFVVFAIYGHFHPEIMHSRRFGD